MDFLRHYPASRLSGVVFVGSTGGMLPFPPPNPETAQAFARLGKLALSPAAGDRLEAARGFVNGMVVAPVAAGVIDREVAAVLAVTPYVRKAMSGRTLDNSDLVGRLQMPVLFVLGDGDRTATPAGVNSLIAQLPAARLSVYPDTGHMPFIERRERFNAELAAFAASVFEAPAIQGGTPP
jgi:pimeloyl-ACP methyl ester carboxylesterase